MSNTNIIDVFTRHFGPTTPRYVTRAPGRVNLIGEHTDYNGLPAFPMTLQRGIEVYFAPRDDYTVQLANTDPRFATATFEVSGDIAPDAPGAWPNYAKAAAQALARRHGALQGMDAVITSDLPIAAGLSSSSALTVACVLSLLRSNDLEMAPLELMDLVAKGERYVGTHGGGMDQAICIGGRANTALKIDFAPLRLTPTTIPRHWHFVVASSMVRAEKSGAARDTYNRRVDECGEAIDAVVQNLKEAAGVAGYPELLARCDPETLLQAADNILSDPIRKRFRHVVTEAGRVEAAREAMVGADAETFGALMCDSHASLRDDYEVSHRALDELVDIVMAAGADGARLTGAGLGGCIVALCLEERVQAVVDALGGRFYGPRGVGDPLREYVIVAEPSDGAMVGALAGK